MDWEEEKNIISRLVNAADRAVNLIALILFIILLLYAAYGIWFTHSLQNGSFLPDELAQYRPDGERPTLEELMEINPDVRSWITVDETHIDYPVVQGERDTDYLNKSVMGEFSLAGSIFLSSDNKRDFSDTYNLLYGHHIEGGAMFADVLEFRDASFFEKHQSGTLWYRAASPARADKIEIFAVCEAGGNDPNIFGNPSLVSMESLPEFADYIKSVAVQYRDLNIKANDRIIALSTCEDAVSFERVVLFGRLVSMSDAEIKAAMKKEKDGAASQRKSGQGLRAKMPVWLLPSAGALLLILIIYVIWRKIKKRREKQRENYYKD